MEDIKLTEEEKKLILICRTLRILREKKSSSPEMSNPNEIQIMVSEELGLGEKLGG